jgi:hypothetical protein
MRFIGIAMLATAVLSCTPGLAKFIVGRLSKIDLLRIGARRSRDLKEGIYAFWLGSGSGWQGWNRDSTGDCDRLARNPAHG